MGKRKGQRNTQPTKDALQAGDITRRDIINWGVMLAAGGGPIIATVLSRPTTVITIISSTSAAVALGAVQAGAGERECRSSDDLAGHVHPPMREWPEIFFP